MGYKGFTVDGESYEVIKYEGRKKIIVQFADGGTKNVTSSQIKQKKVKDCSKGKVKVGDTFPCFNGDTVTVLEVISTTKILIRWESTGQTAYRKSGNIRQGYNKPPVSIKSGDVFKTSSSGVVEVIDYINSYKIRVKFKTTGWETYVTAQQLRNGEIRDRMLPLNCGVGIIGNVSTLNESNQVLKSYITWRNILMRCYKSTEDKNYSYRDCKVFDEWLVYPNFKVWYDLNVIEGYELDKDIFQNGTITKVYSPQTCCFIPRYVNVLLTFNQKSEDNLPNGVSRSGSNYRARCSFGAKSKYVGLYKDSEEAFQAYKTYKEFKIKEVAEELRNEGVVKDDVIQALLTFVIYPDKV